TMTNDDILYINGIDGDTGTYLVEPMACARAAKYARREPHDTPVIRLLKALWQIIGQPHLGMPDGVHADDVTEAGWAVVFHEDEDPAVRDVLATLVEHRLKQVGDEKRVKVLAYDGTQDATEWLASHGVARGNQRPWRVPYYLLLVGSPERIPFEFGRLLDAEYAVGRLHFDVVSQYDNYVASLIDYETSQAVPNSKEAVYFATRHKFDRATRLSSAQLVDPLADGTPVQDEEPAQPAVSTSLGFRTRKFRGVAATKSALTDILAPPAGTKPPAFLFTATHGVGYTVPRPDRRVTYGALVCQDWSGIGDWTPDHYFTAADLPDNTRVHGVIGFHFACFGAGTPSHDQFLYVKGQAPPVISDKPFIAALPKTLLSHPQGGALAIIGHVERAYGYSFTSRETGPQLIPFQNAIKRILKGKPVGYAMKDFNERYALLSTDLSELLTDIHYGAQVSDKELTRQWTERNDAGGYAIIGDPAVRLRVQDLT
ncbi:MAG: hypothetical protein ACE5LU_28300, partial [Anaerolineae bacterium]